MNQAVGLARSTREHRATLLHYVRANAVEGYRQKSPRNTVRIAEILLNAGVERMRISSMGGSENVIYQPAISALEKTDLFMPRWGRDVGAGAAGAGQSQPTQGQGDHPQHQRPGATDYSVAAAGTTIGEGQNQPAVSHGD